MDQHHYICFLLLCFSLLCKTTPQKTCKLCTNPLTFHLVNLTQIHISPMWPGDCFLLKPRVTETTDLAVYFGSREEKKRSDIQDINSSKLQVFVLRQTFLKQIQYVLHLNLHFRGSSFITMLKVKI